MARRRKKVIDKWKTKKWYPVVVKEIFENKEIGEVVSSDPKNLVGRNILLPLSDVSGIVKPEAMFTNVKFKIVEVDGDKCIAKVCGHEMARTYLNSIVRRGNSVVHLSKLYTLKDGSQVRIKVTAVTATKVRKAAKTNIFHALVDELDKIAKEHDYVKLFKDIFNGTIKKRLKDRCAKITPMKTVEVRKTEVKEIV